MGLTPEGGAGPNLYRPEPRTVRPPIDERGTEMSIDMRQARAERSYQITMLVIAIGRMSDRRQRAEQERGYALVDRIGAYTDASRVKAQVQMDRWERAADRRARAQERLVAELARLAGEAR